MQPMYVSIQQKETGNRIKSLLKQNGYTVKDIQGAMGFGESAGGVQMAVWKILAKHRQFYYFEQIIAYQYRRYPRH